jgi:hypothetical protein
VQTPWPSHRTLHWSDSLNAAQERTGTIGGGVARHGSTHASEPLPEEGGGAIRQQAPSPYPLYGPSVVQCGSANPGFEAEVHAAGNANVAKHHAQPRCWFPLLPSEGTIRRTREG